MQGISFIHSCKILHRDLKLQNILINKNLEIKIADFGLSRTYSNELRAYSQEVVTLWYRAPELLIGHTEYNTSIDLWSLGCLFYELLTNKVLFKGTCSNSQLLSIFQLLGLPSKEEIKLVSSLNFQQTGGTIAGFEEHLKTQGLNFLEIDLIKQFLCFSPLKRISAKIAMSHPLFDDLN